MQGAPDAPVQEDDPRAYADLLAAARDACIDAVDGVDEPEGLTTVARLHRSAGLLEHHLLLRLARAEAPS